FFGFVSHVGETEGFTLDFAAVPVDDETIFPRKSRTSFLIFALSLPFHQGDASGIVLNRDHYDRKSCGFFEFVFNVTNCVTKTWRAIRKKFLHPIAWHDDDADINLCILQTISKMN